MLEFDLASARWFWIAETDDPVEKRQREESEFLLYRNKAGLFADFHGLRHTFIANLGKAGVDPKTAQILVQGCIQFISGYPKLPMITQTQQEHERSWSCQSANDWSA